MYVDISNNMDKQKVIYLMPLDLSAAFQTVEHTICIGRMKHHFGFQDNIQWWFRIISEVIWPLHSSTVPQSFSNLFITHTPCMTAQAQPLLSLKRLITIYNTQISKYEMPNESGFWTLKHIIFKSGFQNMKWPSICYWVVELLINFN